MSLKDKHAVQTLTRRVDELETQLSALAASVSKLEERRGPGRPRKDANAAHD